MILQLLFQTHFMLVVVGEAGLISELLPANPAIPQLCVGVGSLVPDFRGHLEERFVAVRAPVSLLLLMHLQNVPVQPVRLGELLFALVARVHFLDAPHPPNVQLFVRVLLKVLDDEAAADSPRSCLGVTMAHGLNTRFVLRLLLLCDQLFETERLLDALTQYS